MDVRVVGKFFQRFAENLHRQTIILLVEGQIAAGQVSLAQVRVGFFGLVEEIFQDQFRLRAQPQRRPTERNQVRGVPIHPFVRAAQLVDFLQQLARLVRVAVGIEDVATQQSQTDTRTVARQRVAQHGLRLGITAGGQ